MDDLLSYDPATGVITWKVRRNGTKGKGRVAGGLQLNGYIYIRVSGKLYKAHRLAWLLHYGVWPKDQIDHINGIRKDNRICNLREATGSNNQRNRGKQDNNTSGYKGVYEHKASNKWMAQCMVNGKLHYLGLYPTAELAYAAYCEFASEHHEEFFHG